MSKPSLRAAIDAKCRDCGGQDGGKHFWRLYTSACPVPTCPLWCVRPLASRNVPPWLASRNPEDLPDGFLSLSNEEAIATIRRDGDALQPVTGCNSKTEFLPVGSEGDDDE